jgi:hypothetical protein
MALQTNIINPYDGDNEFGYYKIVETNIDWLKKTCHVVLAGYYNERARIDGKQSIECIAFDWQGNDFPFDIETLNEEGHNVVLLAYQKIKESKIDENGIETNPFANALDV